MFKTITTDDNGNSVDRTAAKRYAVQVSDTTMLHTCTKCLSPHSMAKITINFYWQRFGKTENLKD
jgi:hypothetical protein